MIACKYRALKSLKRMLEKNPPKNVINAVCTVLNLIKQISYDFFSPKPARSFIQTSIKKGCTVCSKKLEVNTCTVRTKITRKPSRQALSNRM